MAEWIFDRISASRQRHGGSAAEYAFEPTLDVFVREVIQNANDQAVGEPEIEFRFYRLAGERLRAFWAALSWEESLEPHLGAVAEAERDLQVKQYLEGLRDGGEVLVLSIEDRNTVGLVGDETEGESNFRALCKDTLFTNKPEESSAGGSYGLGKSVLWSFSGLSTVLFSSVLSDSEAAAEEPSGRGAGAFRLIGRCELPTHDMGQQEFQGPGWFGQAVRLEDHRGRRAESVWGGEARELSRRLCCERAGEASGTTVTVVGFDPPAGDEGSASDPETYSDRIRELATKHFWPAIVRDRETLSVSAGVGESVRASDPFETDEIQPFAEAFRAYTNPDEELNEPGDVVTREIECSLPPRKGSEAGASGVDGEVTLVVRLASSRYEDKDLVNRVALFRQPGMVVKYYDQSRLALGMRPFHALLICGEARAEPDGSDEAIERFLRRAEPPGHDAWTSTKALRERYKQGYLTSLNNLRNRVKAALEELVVPSPAEGERGPDRLRRRFPISGSSSEGGGRKGPSPFHYEDLESIFADGRWGISATIRPDELRHDGWEATIEILRMGEDGKPVRDDQIPIQDFTIQQEGVEHSVSNGVGQVSAASGVDDVSMVAWTQAEAPGTNGAAFAGEVQLRVRGTLFLEE